MILQPGMPQRRRRKFRPWSPTTFTVILLLIAIVSIASWKVEEAGWFENRLTWIMSAPLRFLQGTRVRLIAISSNIRTAIHAREELETLREEVEKTRAENQELRIAAADTAHLRSLLDLPDRSPFRALPALVINRDLISTPALIINRGTEDGVLINQPVVSPSEGLVGRIERALFRTARVQLLIDYSSMVGVRIEGKPLEAIVRGSPKDGVLILSDVFHLGGARTLPEPGDRVFTSGIGRVFPSNLLVGSVEEPVDGEEGTFRVTPAVDIRRIYEVLILLDIDRREEQELLDPVDIS
ncbi:MAG: rod shape-determining protein MreC [bacterium]